MRDSVLLGVPRLATREPAPPESRAAVNQSAGYGQKLADVPEVVYEDLWI
jgi:hypothetical protein